MVQQNGWRYTVYVQVIVHFIIMHTEMQVQREKMAMWSWILYLPWIHLLSQEKWWSHWPAVVYFIFIFFQAVELKLFTDVYSNKSSEFYLYSNKS